jgi:hypothetical protein
MNENEYENEVRDETVSLHPEWKELYSIAKDWEYGSFHPHEEIVGIINVPYNTTEYYKIVHRTNDQLLIEQSKFLKSVYRKGYRVIEPNEHVEESGSQIRKTLLRFKKGVAVAANTNTERLSQEEAQQLANYLQRAGKFKSLCESNVRKLSRIAGGKINKDVPKLSAFTDTEDNESE